MVMKNKLTKHHKSKLFFLVRNFSFAFIGLLGVGLTIGVPTYISSINETSVKAKATSNKSEESKPETDSEQTEQDSLLEYK